MKRIVSLLIVMMLTITGCATSSPLLIRPVAPTTPVIPIPYVAEISPSPNSTPPVSPGPVSANNINTADILNFDSNVSSAIVPSTMDIGNYYPGATAKWQLIIHNGDGLKNKLIRVETESGETIAAIPLKATLANNGLLDIVSIVSTLKGERLDAIAYDASTQLLTVKGFAPLTKRVVKITYKTISSFSAYYKEPSILKEGFSDPPPDTKSWLTFDNDTLLLRPMENGVINCTLTIPNNIKAELIPSKWLFWIGVSEKEVGTSAQVATRVELCQRILVTMR